MALNIKDPETDALARRLSKLTGESLTVAIKRAISDRLERERRRRGLATRRAALDEALARFDALPVADDRSPDELIGYDDRGLPV